MFASRLAASPADGSERLLGSLSGRRFCGLERDASRFHVAAGHRHPQLGQARPRPGPGPGPGQIVGQRRQPPLNRCPLPRQEDRVEVALDQPGRPRRVPGRQRMAYSIIGQPALLVPAGRGPVAPWWEDSPRTDIPPCMHVRVTPYSHGDSYRSAKSRPCGPGYPPSALTDGWLVEEMRHSAAEPYPPAGGPARAPLA